MAQGDDDVEVTTDVDSSGERLMMLLRLRINCERTQDSGQKRATEDAEDDDRLTAENARGIDDCCATG